MGNLSIDVFTGFPKFFASSPWCCWGQPCTNISLNGLCLSVATLDAPSSVGTNLWLETDSYGSVARFPVLLVNLSANLQKSFLGLVSSGKQKLLTGSNMGFPESVCFFATTSYYTTHIDFYNELCLVGLSNAFLVSLCPCFESPKSFHPFHYIISYWDSKPCPWFASFASVWPDSR